MCVCECVCVSVCICMCVCVSVRVRRVFNAFLNIISGVTRNAPNMPKYSKKDMSDLPMKNYEDLVFPYEWIQYYKGLTPDGKVKHFESMFRNASEHEKTLIINDLKHFFQAPV